MPDDIRKLADGTQASPMMLEPGRSLKEIEKEMILRTLRYSKFPTIPCL